jgi:hypothetical protein
MAIVPIRAYDSRVLAVLETTFGTPPNPAAAQALEVVAVNMGPVEAGVIRPKRDRALGRGAQNDFIEGRVELIPWSLETSLKGRAAVDTVPAEDALYRAAGLARTVNAGTSVVYATAGEPNPLLSGLTLERVRGGSTQLGAQSAERGYGGAVERLTWKGGDTEAGLMASGRFVGKELRGKLDSITLANGTATSLTITAEESYRLGLGFYLCESEAIQVTAVTPGGTTATIVRGVLSTTAAAHTAQPLVPFVPSVSNPTGRPLPESTSTVTVDGVSLRMQSWEVAFTTGISHLPGETGNRRVQGLKAIRYNVELSMRGVLYEDYESFRGRSTARRNCPVTIVQGTGAGRILTLSMPFAEVIAPDSADSADDVALVDLSFRVRDNAGNDSLSLTLT